MTSDAIWICDCGAINEDEWNTCVECKEYRPRPCDLCGTEFLPWREGPKKRLEAHTCFKCYAQVSADSETPEP